MSAAADTVLCCLNDNEKSEEPASWNVSVLRAFEDGIMGFFFDEGHIVTNSYLNECKQLAGETGKTETGIAKTLGNSLGADLVVILEVFFSEPEPDQNAVPETVRFIMYSKDGKPYSEGSEMAIDVAREQGDEELLDSFTIIGRDIAETLMSEL